MTQQIIAEGKVGKIGDKIKFVARLDEIFAFTTSDRKGGLARYYITEWTDEKTGMPLKVSFEDYTSVGKAFKGFKKGNIGFLEAKVVDYKKREKDNKMVTRLNRAKLESFF